MREPAAGAARQHKRGRPRPCPRLSAVVVLVGVSANEAQGVGQTPRREPERRYHSRPSRRRLCHRRAAAGVRSSPCHGATRKRTSAHGGHATSTPLYARVLLHGEGCRRKRGAPAEYRGVHERCQPPRLARQRPPPLSAPAGRGGDGALGPSAVHARARAHARWAIHPPVGQPSQLWRAGCKLAPVPLTSAFAVSRVATISACPRRTASSSGVVPLSAGSPSLTCAHADATKSHFKVGSRLILKYGSATATHIAPDSGGVLPRVFASTRAWRQVRAAAD